MQSAHVDISSNDKTLNEQLSHLAQQSVMCIIDLTSSQMIKR